MPTNRLNSKKRPVVIIGNGHIGKILCTILIENNRKISALSRSTLINSLSDANTNDSQRSNETNIDNEISIIAGDLDQIDSLNTLNCADVDVFYFAPPQRQGVADQRMRNFIQNLQQHNAPARIVYISTTGVYGDHAGNWINEQTVTNPVNDRSKRRLDAEQQIQRYCGRTSTEHIILRVSGIYSLEKLPISRIKKGVKILNSGIAPASNRIHATDLAQICFAAMYQSVDGKIYNVADGNPSSISDYFIQIADLFGLPAPEELSWQQAEQQLSPEMLSYLKESKKIDISLLIQLVTSLEFPNLRSGLLHCKKIYDQKLNSSET